MDSANFILWIASILATHYRLVACLCMHPGYQISKGRVARLDDLQGERPQCLKGSYCAALRLRVLGEQLAGCEKQLLLGADETAAPRVLIWRTLSQILPQRPLPTIAYRMKASEALSPTRISHCKRLALDECNIFHTKATKNTSDRGDQYLKGGLRHGCCVCHSCEDPLPFRQSLHIERN